MKRAVLVLVVAGAIVMLAGGVALAEVFVCGGGKCRGTDDPDTMTGTAGRELMYGLGDDDAVLGSSAADNRIDAADLLDGGGGEDRLFGHAGDDEIYGGRGRDQVHGDEGNDYIYGGPGRDNQLRGFDGDDEVYGGGGKDVVIGDRGSDLLSGGSGSDSIATGETDFGTGDLPGTDRVEGEGGADRIGAQDGFKDIVDCGPGEDTVFFDVGLDIVRHCEIRNP